ncbi:DUF5998 family protein [Allobranchiibius sp. CTAmp26]|uniref:DUF5998 family protein n=1 Tax=Allobranchiibius sp. CTAmp26 TaxID=2815214 RepID=UPI001AA17FF9|nr:DUF5998 family protein [Allobranchiibius sp. CTAmp26]MBO1755369.1 phosphodiesterase [Allobranchiibius sp. CTAmp26]
MSYAGPRSDALPEALLSDIDTSGYYPALVSDVVATALGDDTVVSHLVHAETTFDSETVRRHVTVLVLAPHRLVVVHADDHAPSADTPAEHLGAVATATSETIPLGRVRGVMLAHVVSAPEDYRPGSLGREITLKLGWGTVAAIDIMPAQCADPQCEADHGYEGTIGDDDITLRITGEVDGDDTLEQAKQFAATLSRALGQPTR